MSLPVSVNQFRSYSPTFSPISNIEGRIDTPEAFTEYLKGMTFSFIESFARDLQNDQAMSKGFFGYIEEISSDGPFALNMIKRGLNQRLNRGLRSIEIFLKNEQHLKIEVNELAEKMLCYLDFIELLSEYNPEKKAFGGIQTIRNKFKESFPHYPLIELEKITLQKSFLAFQNLTLKIRDPSPVENEKEAEIAIAVNELGCQIFKKIAINKQDNVAFSPISAFGILQSILVALPEEKGKKLLQEIGLKLSPTSKEANVEITEFFNGIMRCPGDRGILQIVNAAITNQIPSREFERTFQGKVFAFGREVNITTAANAYIKESTHNMIPNFFTDIKPTIAALLVNTVYFKASWEHFFKGTCQRPFNYIGYDPSIHPTPPAVRMMRKSEHILCYDATDLGLANHTMVVLPYIFQGRKSSLIAMMPENAANFDDLKKQLTPEFISQSSNKAKDFLKNSLLIFPKINLEKTIQLKPILEECGYGSVNDYLDNLFKGATLNQIIQKVNIKVDEEGTEAASATGGVVMKSAMMGPKREIVFNRPFIFMIYVDSVQLFCGQVVDATCLERPLPVRLWGS